MLKLKDSKKKFTIIYQTDDTSEHHIIDGEVLTEREKELVFLGDFNKGDIFILDSNDDIDEWEEMTGIYEEDEFKENATCTNAKTYKEFIIN